MHNKWMQFIVAVIVLGLIAGCGAKGSHWQAYNLANEEFTEIVQQYNAYYPMQTPAEQEAWREKFDPVFIKGDKALTHWRSILDAEQDAAAQEAVFNAIKYDIIKILFELSPPPN